MKSNVFVYREVFVCVSAPEGVEDDRTWSTYQGTRDEEVLQLHLHISA